MPAASETLPLQPDWRRSGARKRDSADGGRVVRSERRRSGVPREIRAPANGGGDGCLSGQARRRLSFAAGRTAASSAAGHLRLSSLAFDATGVSVISVRVASQWNVGSRMAWEWACADCTMFRFGRLVARSLGLGPSSPPRQSRGARTESLGFERAEDDGLFEALALGLVCVSMGIVGRGASTLRVGGHLDGATITASASPYP